VRQLAPLHGGSAATVDDAVRRHRGEADLARQSYARLSDAQRGSALLFLMSR
jgi:CxxC motif-containing protein (DUF1111 family)